MERTESNAIIRVTLLVILIFFGVAIFFAHRVTSQRAAQADNAQTKYTNYVYKVSLAYPSSWQPSVGYSYDHYEGSDGFFALSATGTATSSIDELAKSESGHILKPYGSLPITDNILVDGQDARVIVPSVDQDASMHGQAALVVKYPVPVIVGHDRFSYLIFLADKSHIQAIIQSLKFVQ